MSPPFPPQQIYRDIMGYFRTPAKTALSTVENNIWLFIHWVTTIGPA
jgi:hypothetical protein